MTKKKRTKLTTINTTILTIAPPAVVRVPTLFEGAYATAGRAKTIMARGIAVLTPAIASIPAIPALPLLFPVRTLIVPNAIGAIVTSVGSYTVTVPTFETSQGRSLFEVKCSFVTTSTRILCYIEMRSQKNVRTCHVYVSGGGVAIIYVITCSCNSSGEKNEDR